MIKYNILVITYQELYGELLDYIRISIIVSIKEPKGLPVARALAVFALHHHMMKTPLYWPTSLMFCSLFYVISVVNLFVVVVLISFIDILCIIMLQCLLKLQFVR